MKTRVKPTAIKSLKLLVPLLYAGQNIKNIQKLQIADCDYEKIGIIGLWSTISP